MNIAIRYVLTVAIFCVAIPSEAHEFWLHLERGHIVPGESIVGDLKVGQMLSGQSYPYLSERFRVFTISNGEETNDVSGRDGDIPAVNFTAEETGLYVIAQYTTDFLVTHDDWEVFRSYLVEEGLAPFIEQHLNRSLPKTGFDERYTRYIKALVQSGPVLNTQNDMRVGMPFELVAQTNPYSLDHDVLPVNLFWGDEPVKDWQISIFHDSGSVTRTHVITDQDGRAIVPLSGAGEYLLSAIKLQAVTDMPVSWHSHWAALSFKIDGDS